MRGLPFHAAISILVARARSLWHGLHRRNDVEAEMAEEFRHHLELRTEDLIRRGQPPREAARQARIEFGHMDGQKEAARAARGLRVFDQIGFSWLDVKLGARMLMKYPGLSLVSVIGMSVAIVVGAGGFGFIHALVDSPLPLDEGERVVSVQNSDVRTPGTAERQSLHDFLIWRDELRSVRDLSAFTEVERSLRIQEGDAELIELALMTASGFRVARVGPILGRPLLDADERDGAPPVLVIGYEVWQRRFAADPDIIGRIVRLDTTVHTVVGVMPPDFRFPVNHRFWAPLRLDPTAHPRGGGPEIRMFARLAEGVTLAQAQTQLTMIGLRTASTHPETHEHLRPRVLPYTHPFVGVDSPARRWLIRGAKYFVSLLLVAVCLNVAVLVYARTAARSGEIVIRSALGASRRRVVTQLFAEALVLSLVAAVVGLTIAGLGLERLPWLMGARSDQLPFWMDLGLSPAIVLYVAGLAVLAGIIVGVLPALQATGRNVQAGLQQLSAHSSRMRLGRTWTALIVVQVAIAVAILPYALYAAGRFMSRGAARPEYAVEEFLRASLSIDRDDARGMPVAAYQDAMTARFHGSAAELVRRLQAEPSVSGVTYSSGYPGSEWNGRIEVEGAATRRWVWYNQVDVDLFDVFDVPVVVGRKLVDRDATGRSNSIIVDREFAEEILGGGHVLGRRVRFVAQGQDPSVEAEVGPWLEVVGVVPDFTVPPVFEPSDPKLYQPFALADVQYSMRLAVRMRPGIDPAGFVRTMRVIAHDVDPALQFDDLDTASDVERQRRRSLLSLALAIAAVTASVLLLSAAGIYAMMSFTVASRRREIGIRAALGAAPQRVLRGVFARASRQLGAGVVCGLLVAEAVSWGLLGGSFLTGDGALLLPLVAALMLALGLLAALGPARRGLAVQPTEALRGE
jgi:putative ABC transport system permease protein